MMIDNQLFNNCNFYLIYILFKKYFETYLIFNSKKNIATVKK